MLGRENLWFVLSVCGWTELILNIEIGRRKNGEINGLAIGNIPNMSKNDSSKSIYINQKQPFFDLIKIFG